MKKLFIYIITPLFFLMTACEDFIEVELADADQLVVVDAWLDNTLNEQVITLTQSVPYFDSTTVASITDATVVVTSSTGQIFDFAHTTDGKYTWNGNQPLGEIGDDFSLNISHGNDNYTASTSLFRVPVIDSIRTYFEEDDPFNDDGIFAEFISRDLVGPDDTYWIKTYKDGVFFNQPSEINIAWDAGFDSGAGADGLIFIPPVRFLTNEIDDIGALLPWNVGEVCRVEIHSISNEAFGFLELMRDQLLNGNNGIFAEPLANTIGNISTNGEKTVLGVFNVAGVSSMERVIE